MTKFKILIAIILVLVLAWTGGWFYGTTLISEQLDQLASTNSDPQIRCDERSIVGFPFRYDVNCKNATVITGDEQIDVANIKATVRIYSPTHIIGFADAPINWRNEFTGSQRQLDFTQLQLSGRLNWSMELMRISAIAQNLKLVDDLLGKIELANAKAFEGHLIATQNADAGLQAFFKTEDANLIELGVENAALNIEFEVSELNRNVNKWQYPTILRQWQNADGKLIIHNIDFAAKEIQFTANGEMYLDAQGQLSGKATTQSKGLVELFDPEAYGILAPTIFGVANADGEYKSLWTANAGTVSIGVAPLFFVPALF
ncbi:DUF2125 domain-containing protein [Maritalea sp.]|uniref:DUF2125 domain-containing protein n=1 Tax=Maritalea sp. TaxID=2003361 RepID=UPI003EF4B02C